MSGVAVKPRPVIALAAAGGDASAGGAGTRAQVVEAALWGETEHF